MTADLRPSAGDRPAEKNSNAWLLLTLTAVFVLALPSLRYPIGRDQATYCAIAHGLLKGKQLYRDLWDNKPPGIFYIYAVLVSVFGRVMWMVGVVDVLYLVAVGFFIFRFTERYLGAPAGLIAAVLYTLWHQRAGYDSAAQPETFIVLCVFLADLLVMKKSQRPALRHFVAGLVLGAAFWIKYNAGLFLLLSFFLPFVDVSGLDARPWSVRLTVPWKTWLQRAAILTAGFTVVVAIQLAQFWFSGIWPAVKQVQFEVLPRYGTMILQRQSGYLIWVLSTISYNLHPWTGGFVAIALALAWWRREIGRLAPILFSALIGFLVTASQLRFNTYYFETCLPFLAMICAYLPMGLFWEFRKLSARLVEQKMALAKILLWIVFANLLYVPVPGLAILWTQQLKAAILWMRNPRESYEHYWWPDSVEHLRGQMRVIGYIKANAHPQDQIFVWGTAPLIYYMAGKESPNRFVSNLALMSAWCPPAWRLELVRDLEQSPPRFIIVARHDAVYGLTYTRRDSLKYLSKYPQLSHFILRHYLQVEGWRNFVIYRRRGIDSP